MEDSFNVKLGCIYNQITLECGSENVWLFVSPLLLLLLLFVSVQGVAYISWDRL